MYLQAYAGFCPVEGSTGSPIAVATGNWGCGAFKGNPHLKALLQIAACAVAGRDMAYFTFHDSQLKDNIADIYQFLLSHNVTAGKPHILGFLICGKCC